MSFNAPAVSDRSPRSGRRWGFRPNADIAEHLALLAERIGLPRPAVGERDIEAPICNAAARRAAADAANRTNPRHATARDYERMMRAVL